MNDFKIVLVGTLVSKSMKEAKKYDDGKTADAKTVLYFMKITESGDLLQLKVKVPFGVLIPLTLVNNSSVSVEMSLSVFNGAIFYTAQKITVL